PRAGERHRDAADLRVSQPLPDAPARLRLGDRRDRVRARHDGDVRVPARVASRGGGGVTSRPRTLGDLVVVLALALYAAPFFWQLLTSLKPEAELLRIPPVLPSRLTLEHYRVVFGQSLLPRALVNSLGIAGLTTALALVLGVPAAYAIARLPVPGKALLLLAIVGSTAFPQIATVSPLYLIMRELGLRDTWLALVLAHTSFALPLTIWLLAGFVRELPPVLEEAAAVDGASPLQMFRAILLPLLAPGLGSTALLAFLFSWNE